MSSRKKVDSINVPGPEGRHRSESIIVPGPGRRGTPSALRKERVKEALENLLPRGRGVPVLPADSSQVEDMERRARRQARKDERRRTSA